ncbi:type I polyketide synthase, partial [Streptomyces sp. NPDC029006]|uniref:type I polyketide synthase n=1 Tax=Streptomyces sp. NPDC029006 TaxID=3155467 RepID=UPI0033DCD666
AGVSSFGASGTNTHVIVEQAPDEPSAARSDEAPGEVSGAVPWVVSGRGAQALRDQARRLRAYTGQGVDVASMGSALAGSRAALEQRGVVLAGDVEGFQAGLEALAGGVPAAGVVEGVVRAGRVAWLFSGQGAQRAGMGRELYGAQPVFAAAFDEVCGHFGMPLKELLFGGGDGVDGTGVAQPGLFAVEVALFRLLESFGVRADFVAGHSVGEIAAAHVAGVLDLADACRLVEARGRLMGELPEGGAMVSVRATEEEVRSLLEGSRDVDVAAVNGPESVVVSGTEAEVLRITDELAGRGRRTRRLRVSHAFHSPLMEPMLEAFGEVAGSLTYRAPSLGIVSNVTGERAGEFSAGYWVEHVRAAVRFGDGVRHLAGLGVAHFLEVGPQGVLTAMVRENLDEGFDGLVTSVLRKDRPEPEAFVSALAEAWTRGLPVEWDRLFQGSAARHVDLPTYPFQHQRYWPRTAPYPAAGVEAAGLEAPDHPLLGAAVVSADGGQVLLTGRLSLRSH